MSLGTTVTMCIISASCQLDRIQSYLGDEPLGMPVVDYLDN